ncbi:Clp protease ClpP [Streptomyces sp. ActVer]|uniref:head maturation protease, ClpP-related n=1 Tax=Streptomyces sp. ActVer TaxID=3014558 RepID=UPI0022B32FCC|nr:head maturation protease, ClpP-related [Streptomyces sp. ActVer]MCZ4509961.1 Clp protease ClpP [Streptomyces sp. ActVer]
MPNTPSSVRPAVPGPGGSQDWYRIKNAMDAGGSPVAEIRIYGDIGSWGITAAQFVEELSAIDAPEIMLNLSSPGGDVFDGLAVHNALRSHRAKVIVQVDALAASIASVIAMAGDRIIAAPHSQFMVHNAQGVTAGEASELREYADFLERQSDNIAAVYAERAGGTVKQWRKLMDATTWFFADEAVAAGLADEVGKPERQTEDDRAIAAAWDLSVYNYAHERREDAPAPLIEAEAPPATSPAPVVELPAFDPAAFRAAATAALDPMPGYQPEHLRSLMAGVAGDAPAAPEPVRPAAPYVPRPVDQAPAADPQEVAVGCFRSLFAGVANDAPAAPPPAAPAPTAEAPQTVYVPEPPPPAGQVVADYLRAVMTDVANNAPAPPGAPQPEPLVPEPVQAIDPSAVRRALWEAEL